MQPNSRTACRVVWHSYERVGCSWFPVGQERSRNAADNLEVIGRLHVDRHILQDLIIQRVRTVKLRTNIEKIH